MARSWKEVKADKAAIDRANGRDVEAASAAARTKVQLRRPTLPAVTTRPCTPTDAIALLVHAAESCPPGPDHADRLAVSFRAFFTAWGLSRPADEIEAGLQAFLPLLARADAAGELPTP